MKERATRKWTLHIMVDICRWYETYADGMTGVFSGDGVVVSAVARRGSLRGSSRLSSRVSYLAGSRPLQTCYGAERSLPLGGLDQQVQQGRAGFHDGYDTVHG